MTLKELMEMQADFDANHEGRFRWGRPVEGDSADVLEHSLVCLVGEIGEFANILKKVTRGDRPYLDARNDLAEELTDSFIYIMQIANQMGVDIEQEYLRKLAKNRERFRRYERITKASGK
jgi:NTP pyrophosphatase (non-canonical NTP hydrolase)